MTNSGTVHRAIVAPQHTLSVLSQSEVDNLCRRLTPTLKTLFRRCALAVLSSGAETDDARTLFEQYRDFDVALIRQAGGIRLELRNAPAMAFVGGQVIRGTTEHLFSVLRDLLYSTGELAAHRHTDTSSSAGLTDVVFKILRNAGVLSPVESAGLVICWGGHAIQREEYDYTKAVGYALGLRHLDVCTGCGPGAMKGPMKGAAIAHAKQRVLNGRYIGITEPAIIAAEAPNPIVNQLVVMPDIEKRLEAFVRLAHAVIIFPGGVGTAEELLFLLGVLANPSNADVTLPLVMTGPSGSAAYFAALDEFIGDTLGVSAQERYKIFIDDADGVAAHLEQACAKVMRERKIRDEAVYFNWQLKIEVDYQQPFEATHESMSKLTVGTAHGPAQLAANLRRVFSGIVAGNVKESGIAEIETHGPFLLRGERGIMSSLDRLLAQFVEQGRMKIASDAYEPCYKIISE